MLDEAASAVIAVAVSGGRDSMALLHALARQVGAMPAGIQPRIAALHVHHGLMPDADRWAEHVAAAAQAWSTSLGCRISPHIHRVTDAPPGGESVEAWARRRRYAALAQMAKALGTAQVLLAHHQDDQAETVLLQALRGQGLRGVAAMRPEHTAQGITWLRPWLAQPRRAIEAYVAEHGIAHVDDPSNADARHDRNRLRAQVLPAVLDAFPHARHSLAQTAQRAARAQALVDEVAAADAQALAAGNAFNLVAWAALSPARRWHALAAWLRDQAGQAGAHAVTPARVDALAQCLTPQTTQHWEWPDVPPLGLQVQAYRGRLACERAASGSASQRQGAGHAPQSLALALSTPGEYAAAPWGGTLIVSPRSPGALSPALAPERLAGARLQARQGGERFQLAPGGIPRSLKKQFQARGIPAWQRVGPLLVDADGQPLFHPALGLDARTWCDPAQAPAWTLGWRWLPAVQRQSPAT